MSTAYIGEIRILPYTRGAPVGWQVCDGTLLSIAEYEILFQVIGTAYGGDGQTNFAVPDLQSRVPVHQGMGQGRTTRTLGEVGGNESVTLTTQQMGQHFHVMQASTAVGTTASPAGGVLSAVGGVADEVLYAISPVSAEGVAFPATMVAPGGGNQPHGNTAPTLALQYCIALYGTYPSQN